VSPPESPRVPHPPLPAFRRRGAALALAAGLLAPTLAAAAPTCLDAAGETVRCEAPGALPVGVAPSPAPDAASVQSDEFPLPSAPTLFGLVCVLGGLFALIGLMPDFDGWGSETDGRGERD
jgi:hypothetical protein